MTTPVPLPLVTVDARMLRSSGIGTYLAALLPRIVQRVERARFCLLGDPAALAGFEERGRVEVRRLAAGVYSALEQPGLLARTPRDTQVFWAPHVNFPLASPGRLLVTVHDAFYVKPPREARPRLDKAIYLGALMRALPRRAASIVAVSEFTKGELERKLGAFRGPIEVVHNGLEPAWLEPTTAPSPHPKPYLLFVGNLKPHKNLARTLTAFCRAADRFGHDFLVVGGGDQQAYRDAVEARHAARVRFLGPLEKTALRATVGNAAGLVLASLYEGFGLPPLEAMACGVPVLVSRAASLPEVCAEAALYCDPESIEDIARGIEELLTNEATRARLVTDGRRRATRFDWDRAGERMTALIEGLL
jgi:glycosyltransferase involved in cell wall biosynthesis